MLKSILKYQKSFQKLINDLKVNKKVLAIFAFGSIVSGDLWDESDIDLFVLYKDNFNEIRDVYSEILGIDVHMKLLSKESFLNLYKSDGKKGFARNILLSSKIVFSRDDEITSTFNEARYSLDKHIEKWNLVYLGKLMKDLRVTKKYLHNDSVFTSYEILIRALDSFSKLYLNLNGYTVSKDAVRMATNLNDDFNNIINDLFYEPMSKENIESTLVYIERFLELNIVASTKALLEFLNEKRTFLSSYEIKNDVRFKEFDIKIEDILKELLKRNLVKKDIRKLDIEDSKKLINENVYSCKNYNF
ncbi:MULTISPECIES: nucleotidyltransferase domain-containing protein [Clostridium]|uniref:Nucleotidyltransferase domain protein n=1 Tax=Clostridium botulinum (strain Eklund 17B / Type B) TaxID=935198 RepID=B2TMM0_CLOBB|nr:MULTISPECIES: nucleotidyltransferase domain-containing protein [Clostridium]ACD25081.1 nucleotidyltransferase domain protein [Clostridium botulinum B str. Eklund 17B (NRP)]MBN1037936.1 nucleotidyltransferase domain-containing protein [Clostridium botulinum]MBN1044637.1 nucleotidyltransferase domain-containing protein [Clostridium botulinum]MBN1054595.1 nucleotidyltransferase domain-containing protein [Clostridium botulinum]MBN1067242.1 nucleotidyltransferase domain-containing protein [Clost